ncbi:hypothetical protein F4774DRAFT_417921 [Daldinia eschscholtzii]|nr:hypothetical protein F4774DRAFT_417921 [Daldinia eschscholtzii]
MSPYNLEHHSSELFSRSKNIPDYIPEKKYTQTQHQPKDTSNNFKMMDVNRIHIQVIQFRKKIRKWAIIQNSIKEDVSAFNKGGPEAKDSFEERRQYYLDILGISVRELRDAMNTTEIELPPEEIFVEDITRRVRPLTKRYLSRLVRLNQITKCDMQCILDGGYSSVEAFFEDVYNNVNTYGTKKETSSGGTQTTSSIEIYDEDGFLAKQEGADQDDDKQEDSKDDDTDPQKKTPEKEPAALPLGSGDLVPPVKLEASTTVSEDAESDTEAEASSEESESSASKPYLPSEEDTSSSDSESNDSDSLDGSSFMDCPVTDKEIATSDTESTNSDDSDASTLFEDCADDDAGAPDEESISQAFLPALPKTDAHVNDNPDDNVPVVVVGEGLLDTWLPTHNMFYWQYEVIYAAILTAFRFRETFQSARDAYKVDPFADYE